MVYARRRRHAVAFAPVRRLPPERRTWRSLVRDGVPLLYLLGLALMIVALARPQTLISNTLHKTNAIAIEMVVDVSGSMEALDFSPSRDQLKNRLAVVKEMFASFVKKRPDDGVGLVTFGGYAVSRVPLTIDHSALQLALKAVQIPGQAFNGQGQLVNQEELLTAIGDALATACARLEKCELKSKIIVLLSDGESNTGLIKPETAIKAAKALGIRVYTIGVGSNGRAPFLARDMFGRTVLQEVEVRLDEGLLRTIADTTGGHYFNVRDPQGLERALKDIDKLEKTAVQKTVYNQFNEWFVWVLAPGFGLVFLALSLNMAVSRRLI